MPDTQEMTRSFGSLLGNEHNEDTIRREETNEHLYVGGSLQGLFINCMRCVGPAHEKFKG